MKKNKLFQSALSLMLVGGMLTACGSSASSTAASTAASTGSDSTAASTASDSAAPAATKQYVIGIAEAQANDEVTTRRAYLEDFIAPTYNVKFIFSETLKDDAATKTFIENCIDSGADAIIDMKSASGQMAQLCMDNGLVYTINGNYTQHPELLTTDYTNFAGCIGANNAQIGSLFGDWLEENASEDGSEGFLISTSLAAQGNTQHVEITRAILEGLQQKYGITYTKSIDDLIASSETTNVENDKNILITLYPGSPNKDTWLPGISTLLQTGNYKMFLSSGQTYNQSATVVDEVEKSFGMHNRERLHSEEDFPMSKTFEDGIDFLNRNGRYDNWFLQIETFDPHEPFTSPTSHFDPDCATQPDWPPYADVTEGPEEVEAMRTKYEASVRFCDRQLGRVLDLMDELDLWKDTMLIVNTDHGFFLSEHGYWGKGGSPNYEELVHTPLFIWDPRSGRKGVHSPALVQTIDLAPTVLDYFGIEIPADMLGRPLTQTLADDTPVREYALFGYHSMPVGITDGRYTLLRDVKDFDEKTYEYTQMPTHMRAMFSVEEMRTATMAPGFSYTKGTPVMKIEARPNPRFLHTLKGGDMLFDLQNDPHQEHVLEDAEQSDRLLTAMTAAFEENDAPEEMYSRYGLKQYRKKAE